MAQQDPVAEYLKARAAVRTVPQSVPQSDPVAEYLAAKNATQRPNKFHAEYQAGTLAPRIAGQNAREAATAADEEDAQPSVFEKVAAHGANIAQGVPGMEAIEAGVGWGASHLTSHPMGYRESLSALRDATGRIPATQRAIEQIVGGAPVGGLIGESAAVSRLAAPLASAAKVVPKMGSFLARRVPGALTGAAYGALRGAADADLDANRLKETALGGAAGGVVGSILPSGATKVPRAMTDALTKVAADADAGIGVLAQRSAEPSATERMIAAARTMNTPARNAAQQRAVATVENRAFAKIPSPSESPDAPLSFAGTAKPTVAKATPLSDFTVVEEPGFPELTLRGPSPPAAASTAGTRDRAARRVLDLLKRQQGSPPTSALAPPAEPPISVAPSAVPASPASAAPEPSPPIDARMQAMVDKLRAARGAVRGPSPRGDEWTDAELAMGADQPPQDLEELLRRSLELKGVTPVVPRRLP